MSIFISVRLILGCVVTTLIIALAKSLSRIFGRSFQIWYLLTIACQFHVLFYASRPLPNIFALCFVLQALRARLNGEKFSFIFFSAIAVLVFRAELVLLLGVIAIMDLVTRKLSITTMIKYGVISIILALLPTIALDSFFWKRLLWPEGEVLYYNVILNKSSNWGVSPWPWYFYSAIPRAVGLSLFLLPLGIILEPKVRPLVFPAFVFVFLYSFLPHKELRFIIYIFPMLNMAVAAFCQRCWQGGSKLNNILAFGCILHLLSNFVITSSLIYVSMKNYPGGLAMESLHKRVSLDGPPVHVHLDNLACQTGVSRFTQIQPEWIYNKTENLSASDKMHFTHLVIEDREEGLHENILENFDIIETISSFSGISLNFDNFPYFEVQSKPALHLMEKKAKDRGI